jgi:voltage-gated hydrogen channel 1
MNRASQGNSSHSPPPATWAARHADHRQKARRLLSSKKKHYFIMALVSLDVLAILTEVFTALVACDMGQKDAEWVAKERDVLKIVELVFSSCFLLEILLTVWAFGLQ